MTKCLQLSELPLGALPLGSVLRAVKMRISISDDDGVIDDSEQTKIEKSTRLWTATEIADGRLLWGKTRTGNVVPGHEIDLKTIELDQNLHVGRWAVRYTEGYALHYRGIDEVFVPNHAYVEWQQNLNAVS